MSEEIFTHKHIEGNGDLIEIRIWRVPISAQNSEGISYSCVYIRNGKRLVGYDNFEGHGFKHHRHIGGHIESYDFTDEWKLLADFNEDIEKVKRGVIL